MVDGVGVVDDVVDDELVVVEVGAVDGVDVVELDAAGSADGFLLPVLASPPLSPPLPDGGLSLSE